MIRFFFKPQQMKLQHTPDVIEQAVLVSGENYGSI